MDHKLAEKLLNDLVVLHEKIGEEQAKHLNTSNWNASLNGFDRFRETVLNAKNIFLQ